MEYTIRLALAEDYARLAVIAAEGDSADCDAHYFGYVARAGRLLCAAAGTTVVGFTGMISVADVAMVTDLFVTRSARECGVAGRLLDAVLDGWPRRMTFSAQHPAALAAYRRRDMVARGRMLYLAGAALGGGAPLHPSSWAHDRVDLVAHLATGGAVVTADAVVIVGRNEIEIARLDAADAVAACDAVLRAFSPATSVTLYVAEAHPLTRWLFERGFSVVDHDVWCASDGVELPVTLAVLHPGLA